jgi:alpha/beta superfamily hydrolase
MAVSSARALLDGAAGKIEVSSSVPDAARAIAVIAHPHPLFGGTMDNKVVTTLARAFVESGAATFRFNFRGVGGSQGVHDEGRGETEDMLAVIEHARAQAGALPLKLAGFSFGGAVATCASGRADFAQLVLVAPGFRRITGQGMAAILVEQDVTRALGAASQFLCLAEGRVSLSGKPADHSRDAISAAYFGT